MAPVNSRIKVAVIGAGAAGLCAAKHLLAESTRFSFDVFEQQHDVGGTWRYSERVHKDEFGLPIHSSMYQNLRTNLPKEAMAFPGFPFHNCNGKSFIHHTEVLKYLENYAKHYGLYEYIKFYRHVTNVKPLKYGDESVEWTVSTEDLITKEKDTYIYDAVMVCNGHYSVPLMPNIKGLKSFKGIIMHSHDYREPSAFRDLKVVVLGAGASGIDIASELSFVSKEVVLSHNHPRSRWVLPDNFKQENGIESVNETSVTFFGGKIFHCDAILLCTGYLYEYPFLDPSCNVTIGNQEVSPLYLHLINIDYPTLSIFAVPKVILPFPIYNQQVTVFLKLIKGDIELPSAEKMRSEAKQDLDKRLARGLRPQDIHVMKGPLQWEYDDALAAFGKIKPVPDAIRKLFMHVHGLREFNVFTYKDVNFNLVDDETFVQIQ